MKYLLLILIVSASLASCAQTKSQEVNIPVGIKKKPAGKESVAFFAEGCFWHTEIVFQSLAGVRDAVSGYAGGTTKNPDYDEVSSGETGHAETVQVFYDSSKISYETLVKAFFASHDPTTLDRQGNDEGTQYRSIAFYSNDKEKQIVEAEIKQMEVAKKYKDKIVTQIMPIGKFYPAEEYHQEYIYHHPENPYVQHVSIPDFVRFTKEFKGDFKQ